MADRYLLEIAIPGDGYLKEDSSGVLLLEDGTPAPLTISAEDDTWWPGQAAAVGRVLAGAAAALSASVALATGFNSHNDEPVPQPQGGSVIPTVRNSGPNIIRWWQDDELPGGAAPSFAGDEEGWTPPPPVPTAPPLALAQQQDDLPAQVATAVDAPDWFPGKAIVQTPVVRLWDHQDERAPTLLEEDQWPAATITIRADPLAILWATDEDAIQASGMEEESWQALDSLAARVWPLPPAWQDELGTQAAQTAPQEDEWRAAAAQAWQAAAQQWVDDDFRPVAHAEDEWTAPRAAATAPALPQLEQDEGFRPPTFALDENPWTATPPQRWSAAAAPPSLDDEVGTAPAALAPPEDDWRALPPLAAQVAVVPQADDDFAPPRFALDEDPWFAPAPQRWAAAVFAFWSDEDFVPTVAASVVLDDDAWQAPRAAAPPLLATHWADDAFSTVVLAEDGWHAPAPLAPALAAQHAWDDGAAVQQPAAVPDEDYEFRSLVLPAWADARIWSHQDEWPTPLTPLPFDEEPWITFPPVLVAPTLAFFPPERPSDEEFPELVAPPEPPAPPPSAQIAADDDRTIDDDLIDEDIEIVIALITSGALCRH